MAQVGDLIRINSDWDGDCPTLKVGDIAEIERIEHGDEHYVKGHNFGDGDDFFLYECEFDIFRKAGEEDVGNTPCSDFIVDGCLFQTQDGKVRKAERVTDDWVYADDGERYKRMFVERITDVSVYDGYALMEEAKLREKIHELAQEQRSKETQSDRIKRAGTELTELLVRKNHDYGDSFAKQYEKYGLMSALIRMDDKMRRLETLLGGTDAQVDESIKDTLLDLAGYALLASVEAGKVGAK